jgi:uncharacterized protein (UPF0216 family)
VHGDEGAFQRWMRFELDTLHAGLVSQRRLLADLLGEAQPTAPARNGAHAFDPGQLQRFAAKLPTELRYALRMPIPIYIDSTIEDAVYLQDKAAVEALAAHGYVHARADAQGKAWMGRSMALQVLRDWPTLVQFVYL